MSMDWPLRTLWRSHPEPALTHLQRWLNRLFFSYWMRRSPCSKVAPGTSTALPELALTRMQVSLRAVELLTGTTQKSWLRTLGSNALQRSTPSRQTASFPLAEVLNQKALFWNFSTLKSWSPLCLPGLSLISLPSSSQTRLDWQFTISNSSSAWPTFSIIQSCPMSLALGAAPTILDLLKSLGLPAWILRAWLPSWQTIWQTFPLGKMRACIVSSQRIINIQTTATHLQCARLTLLTHHQISDREQGLRRPPIARSFKKRRAAPPLIALPQTTAPLVLIAKCSCQFYQTSLPKIPTTMNAKKQQHFYFPMDKTDFKSAHPPYLCF